MPKSTTACVLAVAAISLAGCGSSVFQSNFNATAVGKPPAASQPGGTASVFGPAGSVVVAPDQTGEPEHWVMFARPDAQAPPSAGMQAMFRQPLGTGTYSFSAHMFMPSDGGAATIALEAYGPQNAVPASFLHLTLTADNRVRIDGNAATDFGSFPRNQIFVLKVTLRPGQPATARIALSGFGARGQTDYYVPPEATALAAQWGAVAMQIDSPSTGSFYSDDLRVRAGSR